MRHIGGDLYLDMADLAKAGVSYDRVVKARQRNSAGWTFLDDPQDRRKSLVRHADLRPDVKALVDAIHGEAVADTRTGCWLSVVQVEAADLSLLRSHVLPDGSTLSEKAAMDYAMACAILRMLSNVTRKAITGWGFANAAEFHADVCAYIAKKGIELPNGYTKLKAKVRAFDSAGAVCIISKKWGNQNSRKIETAQSAWLVAEYAQPTKPDTHKVAMKYLVVAKANGWPVLTETAIYMHLNRSDIQPLWYIGRHGTHVWKNRFAHTMTLRGPSFRDALWCSDGTKLNYFYNDGKGITAQLNVYLIMDVYSEAVLGWSIDRSENFKAQFRAAKAALKKSGHRPLQWLYDNQSGHKKRDTQDFYSRAAKLHFPAQPYNAKSKPIESLIGRMQKEVMRERWYFTGQNITAKSLNSRANMEFVQAHKDNLPSMEQVMRDVATDIARWNELPHPKSGVARLAMYQDSTNPQAQPLDFMDMVELFWYTSDRPVTYTNQGLSMEIGQQRFLYEVCDGAGHPSMEFLRRWTNAKFTVKYDPEDLSRIRLYRTDDSGELRFVASADTKRAYARAVVDLKDGERAEIDVNMALRKAQQENIRRELEELRSLAGIDPETLVEVGYRGDGKEGLNRAEGQLLSGSDDDTINPIDAW
ncbi:MAG: DDE-type integrase/transposase/recombinase [Flavobacteriales bacterium]